MIATPNSESIRQIMLLLHERGVERDEDEIARDVEAWHESNSVTTDMGHAYRSLLSAMRNNPECYFADVFREIEE